MIDNLSIGDLTNSILSSMLTSIDYRIPERQTALRNI